MRHFHKRHLQIGNRVAQHGRFFVRQIAARLFLNHRQLIDKHFRQLQIHFALPGLRIGNLPEKKRGILRVHHDELDEALRKLAHLRGFLDFGHIYLFFAAAGFGGRTVART